MRVGFLSRFDRERITFARENGFGSVELLVGQDDAFLPGKEGWKDKAAQLRGAYKDADIRISCIGGFYVNHMDSDANAAQRHREHVRNCITLAREIGVPLVAGFAGRVMGEDLEKSLPVFKQLWGEHAKFAADNGVKIAFEHCPMGAFHSHFGGINCICTPVMWDRCFEAVPSEAIGLEWDASHLFCHFIDPIANIRRYGHKIFHIHAKDAKIHRHIVDQYGIYHPGAIEHCFVGVGDMDRAVLIKELVRAGYSSDLNIEGWHDAVYRDHEKGPKLEDLGLLISKRHLEQFVDGV